MGNELTAESGNAPVSFINFSIVMIITTAGITGTTGAICPLYISVRNKRELFKSMLMFLNKL